MIFNFSESANAAKDEYVVEGAVSPYAVGIEGALMHVYENECNYNLIMKAAGLSELKYYQETGKDLFLTESGKFQALVDRAVEFLRAAKGKIIAIWNKFIEVIDRFIVTNKAFFKKYSEALKDANPTGLVVQGHNPQKYEFVPDKFINASKFVMANPDDKEKYSSEYYGNILGGQPLSFDQFVKKAKDTIVGGLVDIKVDKEQIQKDLEAISVRNSYLKDLKDLKNKALKAIDDTEKELKNAYKNTAKDQKTEEVTKKFKQNMEICKLQSNACLTIYGMCAEAAKTKAREAKIRLIKAVQEVNKPAAEEKKEEEKKEEVKKESYAASIEDLFKGVVIR